MCNIHQHFQSKQILHCSFNSIHSDSSIKSVFYWHDFAIIAKGTSAYLYDDKVGRQFFVHQVAFDLLVRMQSLHIPNLYLMTSCAGYFLTDLGNNAFSTMLQSASTPFPQDGKY